MLLQVSALHWIPGRSRMTANKNLSVCNKAVLRHPGPAASQRVFTSWRQTRSVEAFRYPNTSSFWCFRWTMSFLNILLKMFNSLRLDRKCYLTGSHWWEIHRGYYMQIRSWPHPSPLLVYNHECCREQAASCVLKEHPLPLLPILLGWHWALRKPINPLCKREC